jgi:cell division septal protein FtsQ
VKNPLLLITAKRYAQDVLPVKNPIFESRMRSQKKYSTYLALGLLALVVISLGLFNASGQIISTNQFSQAQVELTLEQKKSESEICISIFCPLTGF